MDDNNRIFKNANRNLSHYENVKAFSQYVPEHERLNKTPAVANNQVDHRLKKQVQIPARTTAEVLSPQEVVKNTINDIKSQSEIYHSKGFDAVDYVPERSHEEDTNTSFSDIEYGSYLLMYNQEVIEVGTIEYIQDYIENLIQHNDVELNQLVVLKKVEIFSGIIIKE